MDIKEIINDAIISEQKSYEFYKSLVEKSTTESSRVLFLALSEEELAHKKSLEDFGNDFEFMGTEKDFKILEKLMLTPLNEMKKLVADLKVCVKKEEASYKAYDLISKKVTSPAAKKLFDKLSREEHRHMTMLKNELERIKSF